MSANIYINNGRKDRSKEKSLTELFNDSAKKRGQKVTQAKPKIAKTDPVKKRVVKSSSKTVTAIKQTVTKDEQQWLVDPWILLLSMILIALGIIMVGSASVSIADRNNGEPFYYLYRQLTATGLGFVLGALVLFTPMKFWQKSGPLILFIGLVLLVAVLIPGVGREINGSARWIPLGVFNLQVSELIKLAMVIYLAGYLVRHNENVKTNLKGFLMPMIVLSVVGVLLLMEPDLGATVVISATALGMLFLGGVRLWQFAILILLMGLAMYLLIVLEPYRMERLQSFMNPWEDPFNSGFQLTQSLIAFGRGEMTGVGLGNSIQKLFYLPEAHTDFLFAVLAEELGGIGAITVIALFAALVVRIFVVARQADAANKFFAAYLMFGIAIWIGLQAFVNIAVNMGVLPTKGLTLPLMSYGGSSMMIMCVAIALVLRAEHETRFKYQMGSQFWQLFSRGNKTDKQQNYPDKGVAV